MPENPADKFLVRDSLGNIYGPADAPTLRRWVAEGRIIAGMTIAPQPPNHLPTPHPADPIWIDAAIHPATTAALSGIPAPFPSPATPFPNPTPALPATPTPSDISYSPPLRRNLLATLSFYLGIAGLIAALGTCIPFCGCIAAPSAGLLALAAIVLASISLHQFHTHPNTYHTRSNAIAALIMGIATLLLYLFTMIILFALGTNAHR